MTAYPAYIDLSALDGSNGFVIPGIVAGGLNGMSVSIVGDVNGDGLDDFAIGAGGVGFYEGEAYLVFGNTAGFGASLDLTALGSGGVVIGGVPAVYPNDLGGQAGWSIGPGGDIDGDGVDDFVVTASNAVVAGGGHWGKTFVIYG